MKGGVPPYFLIGALGFLNGVLIPKRPPNRPQKVLKVFGGGARDYTVRSQRLYGGSYSEFSVHPWSKSLA